MHPRPHNRAARRAGLRSGYLAERIRARIAWGASRTARQRAHRWRIARQSLRRHLGWLARYQRTHDIACTVAHLRGILARRG